MHISRQEKREPRIRKGNCSEMFGKETDQKYRQFPIRKLPGEEQTFIPDSSGHPDGDGLGREGFDAG